MIEPGAGKPMAEVAEAGAEDAMRAVGFADRAFEDGPWPRASATERGRVLLRAATLFREGLEDFARVEARNSGKPITAARGETGIVANVLEYWGGAANKIFGETNPPAFRMASWTGWGPRRSAALPGGSSVSALGDPQPPV